MLFGNRVARGICAVVLLLGAVGEAQAGPFKSLGKAIGKAAGGAVDGTLGVVGGLTTEVFRPFTGAPSTLTPNAVRPLYRIDYFYGGVWQSQITADPGFAQQFYRDLLYRGYPINPPYRVQ